MEIPEIIEALPKYEAAAHELRDILLTNLVMIGEVPSPTFNEAHRVAMLNQRLSECGLQNCSTDEAGNAVGIIPADEEAKHILVTAHLDTVHDEEADHTIQFGSETVSGRGLADNSLGLAALATLPLLLEKLEVPLEHNLILMGDSRSLGRGNLEGLRFFLENNELPICAGLCIEGSPLERLNYLAVDMLRGEIYVEVPEDYQWTKFGPCNAIDLLLEAIEGIQEIPLPKRPPTSIVLGQISGGHSFNQIATESVVRFEIRSESPGMAQEVGHQIADICSEMRSKSGAEVRMDVLATRQRGGIPFSHPMPTTIRQMHEALGIESMTSPSISELSALIAHEIPAVTIGLTNAKHVNTRRETLDIAPMAKGLALLVGTILAIDGGLCEQRKN